jgi:hypothetical protein
MSADVDAKIKAWNCIIDSPQIGVQLWGGTSLDLYNSTIHGCATRALHQNVGVFTAVNVALVNNAVDVVGTVSMDYCASDDNGGTNNVVESGGGADWINDFISAATGDFTLLRSSNLVNSALDDPAGGLFLNDIDNTTRHDWDVGAYECPALGLLDIAFSATRSGIEFTGKRTEISFMGG